LVKSYSKTYNACHVPAVPSLQAVKKQALYNYNSDIQLVASEIPIAVMEFSWSNFDYLDF